MIVNFWFSMKNAVTWVQQSLVLVQWFLRHSRILYKFCKISIFEQLKPSIFEQLKPSSTALTERDYLYPHLQVNFFDFLATEYLGIKPLKSNRSGGDRLPCIYYTGTCRPKGLFFHIKSFKSGSHFQQKYAFFQNFWFGCLLIMKNGPIFSEKITKNGSTFCKKPLNMGTFFLKFTSKNGLGIQGPGGTVHTPVKKKSAPPGNHTTTTTRQAINKHNIIACWWKRQKWVVPWKICNIVALMELDKSGSCFEEK